jgi:hypothetical protein
MGTECLARQIGIREAYAIAPDGGMQSASIPV